MIVVVLCYSIYFEINICIFHYCTVQLLKINTLTPRQNGCHFPDDIFKRISLNETEWISIKISLKIFPRVPIKNIPALVQIMAWRRPGYKPLSEPMMVSLLTHICVARPQWVNSSRLSDIFMCHDLHLFGSMNYLNQCWLKLIKAEWHINVSWSTPVRHQALFEPMLA